MKIRKKNNTEEEKKVEEKLEEFNTESDDSSEGGNKDCHCNGEIKKQLEERIAALEASLKAKEEENAKLVEKVKLAQAELVNYRCRKDKETQDMLKYCNQGIITDLIPIVDNFERAIKLDDNDLTDELSKFLAGFKMIYASLSGILKNYGVEEISRQGETFDPTLEQSLLTDTVEEIDNEVVLEVLQKGYKLKDRVIRPASVKINQK